jgi:tRNA (guanine37-N1)-methyltransferase
METRCLRVSRKNGEAIRRQLIREGALDLDLRLRSDGRFILLPLKNDADINISQYDGEIGMEIFEPVEKPPRTYKDLLKLDESLMEILPSSFDVLGDICIVKLPDPLISFGNEIGNALLETKRNLKTVVRDRGVKGEFRIRDLEVLAGEKDLETIHVENNLRFRLDPSKVYFSPRLATERMRIAEQTEGGRVLDMFAGVGPFSLTIARHGNPVEVTGIDLNQDCIDFFNMNIRLNSLEDKVNAFLGDSRDAPLGMGPFDRVIMNLPHGSEQFLDTALQVVEEGIIHIYAIVDNGAIIDYLNDLIESSSNSGRKIQPSAMREVHNYSPTQSMMAIDLMIEPDP